jgi:hypothetical protein
MKAMSKFSVSGGLLAIALCVGFLAGRSAPVAAQPKDRVFELRIATVANKDKKTPDLGPVTVDRTFMAPVDFSAIR